MFGMVFKIRYFLALLHTLDFSLAKIDIYMDVLIKHKSHL